VSRRGEDQFIELPWDEMVEILANEINGVRNEYGNQAIFAGSYGWSSAGRFHHAQTQLHRFMNCIGGYVRHRFSYSYAAGQAILPHIVGSREPLTGQLTSWQSIQGNADLMVSFGGLPPGNMQVQSGGCGEHTAVDWIRRCSDSGVRFVNIGPARDESPPGVNAEWHFIRPNTDTALILALINVLISKSLVDHAFVESHSVGFDVLERYVTGASDGVVKNAHWASTICGLPAELIEDLAVRMHGSRTMLNFAWALQRGDHGEQPFWAGIALACALGQIGKPGGGFGFGYGAEAGIGNPVLRRSVANLPEGHNPISTFIPVARIADMLLNPGGVYQFDGQDLTYPEVQLVYWSGGNPFHHHQDLNRLREAFQRPRTIVVNECFWTATAKHADIVLPATTTLERNDLGMSSHDRFVIAMKKVIEPLGDALSDFEIFRRLASVMGFEAAFTENRDEMTWLKFLYEMERGSAASIGCELPSFDHFWETGSYEYPLPERPHVLYEEFSRDPTAYPLRTPSGRIEIFSETIARFGYEDCPGHPVWLEPLEWLGSAKASEHPFHLISSQPRTRLHSQMDQAGSSLQSKIKGREPVWINVLDAATYGIVSGDIVKVWNGRGSLLAGAIVTDAVMQGVLRITTGAWFDLDGSLGVEKHGNPNVLTLDKGTSRLGQGPIAHTCLVSMKHWTDALPEITAFHPPTMATPR
jgi:biotin/methionine sulfoxide reductase